MSVYNQDQFFQSTSTTTGDPIMASLTETTGSLQVNPDTENHPLFQSATTIVLCIENDPADNPTERISPEDVKRRLRQLGIKFGIVTFQDRSFTFNGESPCQVSRFYLPLAKAIDDEKNFVRLYKKCHEVLNVQLPPRLPTKIVIPGLGCTPFNFEGCDEGLCADEVLSDAVC